MESPAAVRFSELTGSAYYLTPENPQLLNEYMSGLGFLYPDEKVVYAARAGDGNMNETMRVITSRRRFILKQSRPWVAKFPELDAPADRIMIERAYHHAIARNRFLTGRTPELLKADPANFTLIIEDLGRVGDMTSIYRRDTQMLSNQLQSLLQYASELHRTVVKDFPPNRELRALNHAHIFDLPFRTDNGFPLDALQPGLSDAARPFQRDEHLRGIVSRLGERYLSEGGITLIHGDYYPGSFLETDDRIFVIDSEFAFAGPAEFDVGVLLGHLKLAESPNTIIAQVREDYRPRKGFDWKLVESFANVEIIRRLIGIAQLPLDYSMDTRKKLLDDARAGLLQDNLR